MFGAPNSLLLQRKSEPQESYQKKSETQDSYGRRLRNGLNRGITSRE